MSTAALRPENRAAPAPPRARHATGARNLYNGARVGRRVLCLTSRPRRERRTCRDACCPRPVERMIAAPGPDGGLVPGGDAYTTGPRSRRFGLARDQHRAAGVARHASRPKAAGRQRRRDTGYMDRVRAEAAAVRSPAAGSLRSADFLEHTESRRARAPYPDGSPVVDAARRSTRGAWCGASGAIARPLAAARAAGLSGRPHDPGAGAGRTGEGQAERPADRQDAGRQDAGHGARPGLRRPQAPAPAQPREQRKHRSGDESTRLLTDRGRLPAVAALPLP